VEVAVVGAHLSGQPLNWQLTDRGARLRRTTTTAPGYRFFALDGTRPAKPGLIREDGFVGPGIEVEIWAMPESGFGSFVNLIPAPLGIGTVVMKDGESVKCFLCEPAALTHATEITHLGSWRAYLKSLA
jgi:allophanate hydrolase